MELLEGRRRLDAELVDEHPPSFLVGLERFRLSTGAIEGEHQLTASALPKRVLSHERLELAHEPRGSAELELRLDPLLDRRQAQLLEARGLVLRKGLVREVAERWSAPELERFAH